jgi:hypothetical protein
MLDSLIIITVGDRLIGVQEELFIAHDFTILRA